MSDSKIKELLGEDGEKAFVAFLANHTKELKFRVIRSGAIALGIIMYVAWVIGSGAFQGWKHYSQDSFAAMVKVEGVIAAKEAASSQLLNPALKKAFDGKGEVVLLMVDSPGGSPTQAYMIYQNIMDLKAETGKKVIAIGADMMTSGAYMVSLAADEIYAAPSSLVGSIGVRMDSYGYKGLGDKFGVERRTYALGDNKTRFDPWLPVTDSDKAKADLLLKEIHSQFIDIVKTSRGARLSPNDVDSDLFSGDFWVATQAAELGLIDGIMTLEQVLKMINVEKAIEVAPEYGLSSLLSLLKP